MLDWDGDICNKNIDAFVGELLRVSLKDAIVCESGAMEVKEIEDR